MSFTGFADNVPAEEMVENITFWPAINVKAFQEGYRLPGEYRLEMLKTRLKLAILWANGELRPWVTEAQASGYTMVGQIPSDYALGDESPEELLYVRAVSCYAKALLLSDYATMLRKSDAHDDTKESEDTAGKWYRYAIDAVNDLQRKPKIHVEAM